MEAEFIDRFNKATFEEKLQLMRDLTNSVLPSVVDAEVQKAWQVYQYQRGTLSEEEAFDMAIRSYIYKAIR